MKKTLYVIISISFVLTGLLWWYDYNHDTSRSDDPWYLLVFVGLCYSGIISSLIIGALFLGIAVVKSFNYLIRLIKP